MGRGEREVLLDMANKFRYRKSGEGIYKLTSFTLAHPMHKGKCHKMKTISRAGCCGPGLILDMSESGVIGENGRRMQSHICCVSVEKINYS